MNSFEIIKTVRVTEKGTRQSEKYNQYTVVADRRANKGEIRHAVQELFKVKVIKVNTLNVRGKARRKPHPLRRPRPALEKSHRHPQKRRQNQLSPAVRPC
jgi:ribosomal protein L23